MNKTKFKQMIVERFKKVCVTDDKIVDWNIWNYKSVTGMQWHFQIIAISKYHVANKYSGWLNEDDTISINYNGCI